MTAAPLDPWNDAAVIASRLSSPDTRLILMVGAEAWCQTCRTMRPVFELSAQQQATQDDVWMWLDLEDHAEFLNDFIPESLPIMIAYRGDRLTHALVPGEKTVQALTALLSEAERIEHFPIPDLRVQFMTVDWAA